MSTAHQPVTGCAVIVIDDRLGDVLPAAAAPLLRGAATVHADAGLSEETRTALGATPTPSPVDLLTRAAREPVVLVTADPASGAAEALRGGGARWVGSTPPAGVELLEAVAVMDRLRSPGGCPWDAEQTHESLRRYLVEETYELLDALERQDRAALREELGDVLLQVLFHARVAAEDDGDPFGVDEVAASLVTKLISRHPHVFADGEPLHSAESQQLRWEELKQREKRRDSLVDGVALGQPAVALAAKLAQRASRADLPAELLPRGETVGARLFALAAQAAQDAADPEDDLRAVALDFVERVRVAEQRARRTGHQPPELTAEQWWSCWPGSE
ncbi:XTP/dITP diphosphohydrolase [Saccharopolyspora lacisalsi]|uniref:XTP/dITP diphosphohydrolase n=1 Tax=Halosaccharopolyspora lacisalsi TaxID=1000566 RepID=A0A839DTU9_9PSEU|nr:MazG family protein [Halosaccharopolyspora lacisalsi]MBA8822827.1 XTP/dITP diphosphohydrolase [Halosaccharopolyspora lacisalsi]